MRKDKTIYWLSTGIISGFSIAMSVIYVVQNDRVAEIFTDLGYPTYLIYPLALSKFTGALVLIFTRNNVVKDFAYAGFFFNFLIALGSHIAQSDGKYLLLILAILVLGVSYYFEEKVYGNKTKD